MLYPTSYLKSKGLGKACALVTDGRFSGGSSGLSIGHLSPEAAEGGNIGLVRTGDRIAIDIPNRSITLEVSDEELRRRARGGGGEGRRRLAARQAPAQASRPRCRPTAALTTSSPRAAPLRGSSGLVRTSCLSPFLRRESSPPKHSAVPPSAQMRFAGQTKLRLDGEVKGPCPTVVAGLLGWRREAAIVIGAL